MSSLEGARRSPAGGRKRETFLPPSHPPASPNFPFHYELAGNNCPPFRRIRPIERCGQLVGANLINDVYVRVRTYSR